MKVDLKFEYNFPTRQIQVTDETVYDSFSRDSYELYLLAVHKGSTKETWLTTTLAQAGNHSDAQNIIPDIWLVDEGPDGWHRFYLYAIDSSALPESEALIAYLKENPGATSYNDGSVTYTINSGFDECMFHPELKRIRREAKNKFLSRCGCDEPEAEAKMTITTAIIETSLEEFTIGVGRNNEIVKKNAQRIVESYYKNCE